MILNKYLIELDYGVSTVRLIRYCIPSESVVDDLKEWLSVQHPEVLGIKIFKVTNKKVDLCAIDLTNESTVKRLKLQYVKYQLEKGQKHEYTNN